MRKWIALIPPFLVRFFARPYVAGDSLHKAMDAAASLWSARGLRTTLDLLAEGIDSPERVRDNIDTYLAMVDAVATDPRLQAPDARPTLSLKLSSYTTKPLEKGGDASGAREAALEICEHARSRGVSVTIDMESRHWTDYTLELLHWLHGQGHDQVGCVLQSRLHRTEHDIDRLPRGIRTRIVIGIYQEPAEYALTDKAAMKDRLLALGEKLLDRGHYVEFATHDEACIQRFVDQVVPRVGATPDRFEIQMLYGVPRERTLADLTRRGIRGRLYVPFSLSWDMAVAYLRRRLDEYPAMMFLVARNMLRLR